MTYTERANLIASLSKDLADSVEIYEKASEGGKKHVWAGCTVDSHHSKCAIKRRIVEIRKQLLQINSMLNN